MYLLEEYIAYLKDNPEGYWFKRKLYGFGWVPARRAGWLTLGLYLAFVFGLISVVPRNLSPDAVVEVVVLPIVSATLLFFAVVWRTGESLRWQWSRSRRTSR
ncbi:MAG: hypothetical protein ACOC4E_02060 [Patescibacteria group bacterium]